MAHTIFPIAFFVAVCSFFVAVLQSAIVVRPLLASAGIPTGESKWGWQLVGYPVELFATFNDYARRTGLTGFTVWHARWYVPIQILSWLTFVVALSLARTSA